MIALFFLLPMASADEGDWDVSSFWRTPATAFTEKGTRHFESNGSMLRSIRLVKRTLAKGETCAVAVSRLRLQPIGESLDAKKGLDRYRGWGTWEDDLDAVENCSDFPCKIKFNEPETLTIAAKPKEGRLAETLARVEARVQEYSKNFRRRGYDLPEDPVDPWTVYPTKGHILPATLMKSKPEFFARKLKFGEGSYRPLRQVFDDRLFEEKNRAVRIARDVYTAHYFDGWGEWREIRCSPEAKEVYLLQDLLMEFDLLKNTDFFSIIARPKMRQGVNQESLAYQKAQAGALGF